MNQEDDGSNEDLANRSNSEAELEMVRESLRGLQFGTVTIVVQDGVIVQIDRTDKRRVRRSTGKVETPDCK